MDILWYGLQVAVVGMLVVFAGLIILILIIPALKLVGNEKAAGAPAQAVGAQVVPAAPLPVVSYTPGPAIGPGDGAFFAVVSAAIATALAEEGTDPETGFKIVSVTPV